MSRGAASKDYRTFVGGLVTEATGLSYPENACKDMDNVELYRSGAVLRRRGLDVKPDEVFFDGDIGDPNDKLAVTTHLWDNVGNLGNLNFGVVQSGKILIVFDLSTTPYTELIRFDIEAELDLDNFGSPELRLGGAAQPTFTPTSTLSSTDGRWKYNRMLTLDMRLDAFYPSSFSFLQTCAIEYFPSSIMPLRVNSLGIGTSGVISGTDNVLSSANEVIVRSLQEVTGQASVAGIDFLITANPDDNAEATQHAWSDIYQRSYKDYETIREGGVNYVSYLQTGDIIFDDLSRYKQATYVHSYFDRTEENILSIVPDIAYDYPSSCTMQARWDWQGTVTGGRWSDAQQAYKFRRPVTPTVGALDNGEEILYTKLKARGSGRALSLYYESEEGKDFRFLGFSVNITANGAA